jgi:hypothetical protein
MPSDIRRRAKAINFGIVYGISAFGLANQLSIPQAEAGAYIKTYFERFPGIRTYMDATRAQVRETGMVSTWPAGRGGRGAADLPAFLLLLPITPNCCLILERAWSSVNAPFDSATSRLASVLAGASGCLAARSLAICVIGSDIGPPCHGLGRCDPSRRFGCSGWGCLRFK